jgi:uncharacterized protein YbjT (DUF2867 family)
MRPTSANPDTGRDVFVTGGTGYIGSRLLPLLRSRGHRVAALVRPGSESKLPAGCEGVPGDALRLESFAARVAPADTFVQLVGVAHPSPSKATQFRQIDLASAKASAEAAARAGVAHFVYVSVARPAPVLKAYQQARAEAEAFIREKGLNATFLRPWYVLGPGHRWPYLLLPVYRIAERLSSTRESARRLGLVTIRQMLTALVFAVENPARGIRILEVPALRAARISPPPRANREGSPSQATRDTS